MVCVWVGGDRFSRRFAVPVESKRSKVPRRPDAVTILPKGAALLAFFVRCRQLGKAPCHSVAGCNSPLHALVAGSAELTDWLQTAPDEKLLVLPTHYWRSLSVKKLSLCANWTSFSGAIYDYFDMFVSI